MPAGSMQWAASTAGGVVPSAAYPYTGATGTCASSFSKQKQKVLAGSRAVDLSTPNALYAAVLEAPATITIWADGLDEIFLYAGGVFTWPYAKYGTGKDTENHAVVLVGWGADKMSNGSTMPYWLVSEGAGERGVWVVGVGVVVGGGSVVGVEREGQIGRQREGRGCSYERRAKATMREWKGRRCEE